MDGGRLLAEVTMQLKLPQSQVLLSHVETVLKIAHVDKKDLTALAVSIGPGSFTGLRIGLATVKMMAYALDIPVVAVPSLEVLAWHYPVPGIYTAATLDAQKGNAYFALYEWNGTGFDEVQPTCVKSFADVLEQCGELNRPVIFTGDIAQKKAALIDEYRQQHGNISLGLPHLCMPRAANAAMAALPRLQRGETANIMNLEPVYIRRSEAEVLWEKRHGKAEAKA